MATKSSTIDLLKKIDIFAHLKKSDLEALASVADRIQHKKNEIVYKQGEPSDSFNVVESGVYDVFLWDELLQVERPIDVVGSGEIFGEMGLLTGRPRSAFIRCKDPGSTFRFGRETFFEFLKSNPAVTTGLATTIAYRLDAANRARRIPFENISRFKITSDLIQLLPLQVILRHKLLPLSRKEDQVKIGMVDPSDLVGRNVAAEFLGNYEMDWACISQPDFENFLENQLYDLISENLSKELKEEDSLYFLSGNTEAALDATTEVSITLNEILQKGIQVGASDIHFEPGPRGVSVRARIDGRMIDHSGALTLSEYRPLVSRIKVLSDLDITETRLPQEASVRAKYGNRHIDMRISTLPTPRGESVVIRLLDPDKRMLDLHSLVVNESVAELVENLFFEPHGLVLVTGPTGSGKTTTLYSGIQVRLRKNPTNKLITAEDPVEYEFENAAQVQVNQAVGLDFATILRSLLRQDPDVVLVGEMRDKISMDIAFEAALTGHFVMSSLHTNSAFETIQRLRQRQIESFIIASTLKGVISQRLVAKLCPSCSEDYTATEEELRVLKKIGILENRRKITLWKAPGCMDCRMMGTRGRIGLFEVLVMSPPLREALERNATLSEMEKVAQPETHIPMRRYASYVLEKGLVSLKDILPVFPAVAQDLKANDTKKTSRKAARKKTT